MVNFNPTGKSTEAFKLPEEETKESKNNPAIKHIVEGIIKKAEMAEKDSAQHNYKITLLESSEEIQKDLAELSKQGISFTKAMHLVNQELNVNKWHSQEKIASVRPSFARSNVFRTGCTFTLDLDAHRKEG